jgi:hypothetical protein
MKSADLAKIVAAEKPTWADGTPIRIILRPRSDTDTALLGDHNDTDQDRASQSPCHAA